MTAMPDRKKVTMMDFTTIRDIVCADCKDDGECFKEVSRLDLIERLTEQSDWHRIAEGKLFRLYARKPLCSSDEVVLISSHVDCVYGHLFCTLQDSLMQGTFDNSLTNAAVVSAMLRGMLPDDVAVAFTGDEEKDSGGAKEVVEYLSNIGCGVKFVVVTDVTNVGWQHRLSFTIENDLNIDLLTAHTIVEVMKEFAGHYGFVHDALPDETWRYGEYGFPCLTLCYPVDGDMHSDAGATARLSDFTIYCNALERLSASLSSSFE